MSNGFDVETLLQLRLVVGFLGERDQAAWWQSAFMAPTSEAFLAPVFVRTTLLARYSGAIEAARSVHDERIGVGRVFHLFRLPETIEQRLFETMRALLVADEIPIDLASPETARAALYGFFDESPAVQQGPVKVGDISDLTKNRWLSVVAGAYSAALDANVKCFPYFLDKP